VRIHDEAAELAAEIKKENAAGGDVGSLVLSTPTIRKEWKFVVASIYKCEGLPVMDGKVGMGIATVKQAGTDAFCKFSFAGGKPIKTKVVTRQGTSRLEINPEFNYELWYPVSVPTMTQVRSLHDACRLASPRLACPSTLPHALRGARAMFG
jgi:hypothetical protein